MNRLKPIIKNKIFIAVLILKFVFILFSESHFTDQLFLPFVKYFVESGYNNPWDYFLSIKQLDAFPYSSVMLTIVTLPFALISQIGLNLSDLPAYLSRVLIKLPILIADFSILFILSRWYKNYVTDFIWLYWASPILIYINYIHGQLDAIPSVFLFLSLFFYFRRQSFLSGLFIGLGVATKFHLALSLVLFTVQFLRRNNSLFNKTKNILLFLAGTGLALMASVLPVINSDGYKQLVLYNEKSSQLFDLQFDLGSDTHIYVSVFLILAVLLRFFHLNYSSRNLFLHFNTLLYSVVILCVSPMPGWYYWSLPLFVVFFVQNPGIKIIGWVGLNLAYLNYFIPFDWSENPTQWHHWVSSSLGFQNLSLTVLQLCFAYLVYMLFVYGIRAHSRYNLNSFNLLIGIGGESGAGKDVFSSSLINLLGSSNCTQNDGDDYHLWERGHSKWQQFTHFDPNANDVFRALDDVKNLKQGIDVTKRSYDHSTGRFTSLRAVKDRPFLFYVGLHPFYLEKMRDLIPVKIYLDPKEELRVFWKIRRDMKKRGYTQEQVFAQIEKRKPDARKHIEPQRDFADWIVSYGSDNIPPTESIEKPKLFVNHTLKNSIDVTALLRQLNEIDSLSLTWNLNDDLKTQTLKVSGKISKTEIQEITHEIFPDLNDWFNLESINWSENLEGIAQLIFFTILLEKQPS